MKLLFNLFVMVAAGVLGYLAEPTQRFQLTGIRPSATEKAKNSRVVLQMPDKSQIDIASLSPEQLPQRVLLKTDVKVTDAASTAAMILQAGSHVKLVRVEAGNAVVSPDEGAYFGLVPIMDTDLAQQLTETPPTTDSEPVTPPAPVSSEPPAPTPDNSQNPVPPAPKPTPAPEQTPAADPPAPPAPAPGTSDLVKAMQDSVKAGEIKEFKFDQVQDWAAGTDELIDGQTYQIGFVSYKAETIFGVKTIQAKALIKNGKVQRWLRPKTGLPIK